MTSNCGWPSPPTARQLLSSTADLLGLRAVSPVSARALELVHYRLQQTI
ncbi:hypothetical protein ACWEQL_00135 [Kitasatospora sp. NPDC004240]